MMPVHAMSRIMITDATRFAIKVPIIFGAMSPLSGARRFVAEVTDGRE
jgi:hypothetical protein